MDVVVMGGSTAGLFFAAMAAGEGHKVTVLERDAGKMPLDAESAWHGGGWKRPHHTRQPHAFAAGARLMLREAWPEAHNALLAAGAGEYRLDRHQPEGVVDEDLIALGCRRTTFDWVLRRKLADRDGVRYRPGVRVSDVDFVVKGGVPHVGGVSTADGERFTADVVVDAMGRNTPVSRWLHRHGIRAKRLRSACDTHVHSRFYRLRDGARLPILKSGVSESVHSEGFACYAFLSDNATFSISFVRHSLDDDLARLARSDMFDRAVPAIGFASELAHADVAEPIGDVQTIGGMRNTLNYHAEEGRASVVGLFALGDALCATNPAFGFGIPLALRQGLHLVDVLRTCGTLANAAQEWLRFVSDRISHYWLLASYQDCGRNSAWRRCLGRSAHICPSPYPVDAHQAYAAAQVDAGVWRALTRVNHLIDPPEAFFCAPDALPEVNSPKPPSDPVVTRTHLLRTFYP